MCAIAPLQSQSPCSNTRWGAEPNGTFPKNLPKVEWARARIGFFGARFEKGNELKNIRTALITAAITGSLTLAPIALSTATANADSVNWDAVAACESGNNWGTNTGNGFYGGLQFLPSTWRSHGGAGMPQHNSREEQIRVAENVLHTQGLGAWPVCGARG